MVLRDVFSGPEGHLKQTMLAVATFAALGLCAIAMAQQPSIPQTTQPQTQLPRQQPVPQGPVTQALPNATDPGRPLPRQSTLEVLAFQNGGVRCNPQLAGATVAISARLPITYDPVRAGYASIDVLVDGVSVGAESLRVTDGHVLVNRRVNVAGASGSHTLIFVLDGGVRSAPQTFSHTCISSTPTQTAPGVIAPADPTPTQTRTDHQPGVVTRPVATAITVIIPVHDGLRAESEFSVELETTDGLAFTFQTRGAPDNSVMRFGSTIPYRLTGDKIHRVRLHRHADRTRLNSADAGDSVYVEWVVIEGGEPRGPATRLWESGNLGFSLSPRQWWQSNVVNRRRIPGDQPVHSLSAEIFTGADDLRVRTHEGTWYETHSILEVSVMVNLRSIGGVPTPAGASASSEVAFGNFTEAQRAIDYGHGYTWPALTPAQERGMSRRELRQYRMWSAFRYNPNQPGNFDAWGVAGTWVNLPEGVTLRDLGRASLNADLGRTPDSRYNLNNVLAGAIMGNDEWDYGGAIIRYTDPAGVVRILYSDRLNYHVPEPRRFFANGEGQNEIVAGR